MCFSNFKRVFWILTVIPVFLCAKDAISSNEIKEIAKLTRTDNIPDESIDGVSDSYFEGYIQALIDMHYYEYKVAAVVKDHHVTLANLPKNEMLANSILSFVRDIKGVKSVSVYTQNGQTAKEIKKVEKFASATQVGGIWFPQTTELFLPMIANPRQVVYSVGYRGGDQVIGKETGAVSLGDDFAFFRWREVGPWRADIQIGIEAGIWSVFNLKVHGPNPNGGAELVNTDFYVGIPVTYAVNKWAYKFRVYHISSHLGDEFMVNHPTFRRLNPSFEAFDVFASFQANDILRIYGGPGLILHSDKTFRMKHWYLEYGFETRFGGKKMDYHKLYGTFFAAAHFRTWQRLDYNFDGTFVMGYEWSKLQGVGRKIRLLLEYHTGYSLEGQFFLDRTHYGAIKFCYGF
jgi:hypothetical protein